MQGSEFLYFLTDEFNRFYRFENGSLKVSGNAVPLQFSPDGWQDFSIKNKRNQKYWGLDRTITIPFNYVEDGADILKAILYTYGPEAKVYLIVCQQQLYYDGSEYGFWYKQLIKADVDLSNFNHSGFKVTVNCLEDGFVKYLKANENTVYEIPMDEYVNVKMDGIKLKTTTTIGVVDQDFYLDVTQTVNPSGSDTSYFVLTNFYTETETGSGSNLVFNNAMLTEYKNTGFLSGTNFFMQASGNVDVSFSINNLAFSWQYTFAFPDSLNRVIAKLYLVKNNGTVVHEFYNQQRDNEFGAETENVNVTETVNFSLVDGEKVFLVAYLYLRCLPNKSCNTTLDFTDSEHSMQSATRFSPTYIKAVRPAYLFQKLIEKVTDLKFEADSTLLTEQADKVFTSGDGLRKIEDAVIKTSLSDFYQFWDVFKDCALVYKGGNVRLERKVDLLDYSNPYDIGEVSRVTVSVASDLMFNTLKIGYPDTQQEGLNGKQAFNNTFEWSLGALRVTKQLDKTTKYITDCFAAETTRIEFFKKDTTDSRQDNDVYVIHIGSDLRPSDGDIPEHYLLDRSLNTGATGILDPGTVFNIGLSPKRCLLNNGGYLHSVLDKMEDRYISFTTSPKNKDLITQVGGEIAESADVKISDLIAGYFRPYYIEFEVIDDFDLLDRLEADPLQLIQFSFRGATFIGIPEDVGYSPSIKKEQVYKVICAKNIDLKPLITYNG